jgi:hypothetical protein
MPKIVSSLPSIFIIRPMIKHLLPGAPATIQPPFPSQEHSGLATSTMSVTIGDQKMVLRMAIGLNSRLFSRVPSLSRWHRVLRMIRIVWPHTHNISRGEVWLGLSLPSNLHPQDPLDSTNTNAFNGLASSLRAIPLWRESEVIPSRQCEIASSFRPLQ